MPSEGSAMSDDEAVVFRDAFEFPLTESGLLRIPPRVRERYLDPHVEEAVVQAAGAHLRVWLWSTNEQVMIEIPFDGFRSERLYERSITRWGVNVSRWLESGNRSGSTNWWNSGTLEPFEAYDGTVLKRFVTGEVYTHEMEDPR